MRKDSRFGPVCVVGWGGSGPLEPLELLDPVAPDHEEQTSHEQPDGNPELATAC
ncbi:hypothetical protein [Kribbella deserti]|uniref:Uncharacterized protein n=1 Tax=Kribbella deserti TaxID=1926257 RepID=A0ABV6QU28_9ACTN